MDGDASFDGIGDKDEKGDTVVSNKKLLASTDGDPCRVVDSVET